MSKNDTFKSAVVGVDFSDGSKQALRVGAYMQNKLHVPVTAHHVVDADGIDEGDFPASLAPAASIRRQASCRLAIASALRLEGSPPSPRTML